MLISFAWTTDAFLSGQKTVTRRDWSDRTFDRWCKAWDEKRLVHDAWDKNPRNQGVRVGKFILTTRPFRERLGDFPAFDLEAEGGFWSSVAEYQALQGGNLDKEFTVIRFCKLQGGSPLTKHQKSLLFHKLHRQHILGSEIASLTGFNEKEVYRILNATKPKLPPEEQFTIPNLQSFSNQ